MNAKLSYSARWPAILVAIVIVAPVLYVLSVGPLHWLCFRGAISDNALNYLVGTVYAPLLWASDQSPAITNVLTDYCLLGAPPEFK